MFWTRKDKEQHRYYLLPGMGRSNRRKHAAWLKCAILVGVIVSALFGVVLYILSRP